MYIGYSPFRPKEGTMKKEKRRDMEMQEKKNES
jgi:hypothetical protein